MNRLRAVKAEGALTADPEFRSAIFRLLPPMQQSNWTLMDRSGFESSWAAFFSFLKQAYIQATRAREEHAALHDEPLAASEGGPASWKCFKCDKQGHLSKNCPQKSRPKVAAAAAEVRSEKRTTYREAEELAGDCPVCSQRHTYNKRFPNKSSTTKWPADQLSACHQFRNMSAEQRGLKVREFKACIQCLTWKHEVDQCDRRREPVKCAEQEEGGQTCGKQHHAMLHASGVAYCLATGTKSLGDPTSTIQFLQDIFVEATEARIHWDTGCSKVMVTHEFATKAGFRSRPAKFKLQVVGHQWEDVDGKAYHFEMTDRFGHRHSVWGYGIEKITVGASGRQDISGLRHLFPHVPPQAFKAVPEKPVDILFGVDYFDLHPAGGVGRDQQGHLRALRSLFGNGWLIVGGHPDVKVVPGKNTPQAMAMASVCRVGLSEVPEVSTIPGVPETMLGVRKKSAAEGPRGRKPCSAAKKIEEFYKGEDMGVLPQRRCDRCSGCSTCSDSGMTRSRQEEAELALLKQGIRLDQEKGEMQVKYPFIRDPRCLADNRHVAIAMAAKLEARLGKSGLLEQYNEEFQKFIERGAIVEVTSEELRGWEGPMQYISHHPVIKEESGTTPMRIVSNSSLRNQNTSLNDCLAKGPNSLNDGLEVLLRFRSYQEGLVYDISKAYQQLKTGDPEKYLRLLVWR